MKEALLAARLVRTEAALLAAQEAATTANQANRRFLAHLGQEIRTPMNGLLGMLEHVLHSSLSIEQRNHLQTAQNSAEDLLAIINDLLDLSQLEAGQLELHAEDFRLRGALDEVLHPLLIRARQRGLNLTRYVAPAVPDALHGDSGRLRQVLLNLVGNALKFTAQGSIHVIVDAQRLAAKSDLPPAEGPVDYELRVTVSDSGIGIEPEKVAHPFSPLAPSGSVIHRRFGDTGLGLAICQQLVSLMGGTIQARSQPGKGSEFSFTVRLQEAWKPVPASTKSEVAFETAGTVTSEIPDQAPSGVRPMQRLRVLVADDHPVNREVAAAFLQKLGHPAPAFAENGRAALNLILQTEFDVVLMDVQMPVMDGLEATRELRRREDAAGSPRLPVIALTSHAGESERTACFAAGMDDFLTKPVRRVALAQALESAMERLDRSRAASAAPKIDLTPELRDLLRRTTDEGLVRLREALAQRDIPSAGRAAHYIKGGLGILEDPSLAKMATVIEDTLGAGDVTGAALLTEQLAAAVDRSI